MRGLGEVNEGRGGDSAPPEHQGRGFTGWILDELRELLPAWAFFLLLFSLLWFTEHVLLAEHHFRGRPPSRILIGSFIVAKGLLLADLIPVLKRLDRVAIVSAAGVKTLFYVIVVFLLQYVEVLFDLRHQGLMGASRTFGRILGTAEFWLLETWLVTSLFIFSATKELIQTLGRKRFWVLLCKPRPGVSGPDATEGHA